MSGKQQNSDQSKRILLLGSQMETGGAQALLLSQAAWFTAQGHAVQAAFFYDKEGLHDEWQAQHTFPIINLRAWKYSGFIGFRIIRLGLGLARLYRLMRVGKFDIIETFTLDSNTLGLPVAWAAGISARIGTHHGVIENVPRWRQLLHGLISNSRITSWLVLVSQDILEKVIRIEKIHPKKMLVLPNSVDLPDPTPEISTAKVREGLNVKEDDFLIICVGRMVEQKGHVYLLDAMQKVVEAQPRARLIVAGDGELRPKLEARIEQLGLAKHIRLLGVRKDIVDLLAASDLFVLPSVSEGHSLATLEAMTMGLPAVVTQVDGMKATLTDSETGLIVPSQDPGALADAILRLMDNAELRQRLGANGREFVLETFSFEGMCQNYEQLFFDTLSGNKPKL